MSPSTAEMILDAGTPSSTTAVAEATARASRQRRRPLRVAASATRWVVLHIWPIVVVLLLWQALVEVRGYNSIIVPEPSAVLADLASSPMSYLADVVVTLRVALLGLVIGLAFGLMVAIAAWSSRVLAGLVVPAAVAMYAVPTLAFIPVLAKVLGYNGTTIVAIASIISFFPAFVYVTSGLRSLPGGADAVFDSLGADRRTVLRRLALPAAVPNLLLALRVSASTCVVAGVVAEYLMGTDGLGQAFVYHYKRFEMDRAFGVAIVIMALSLVMFAVASRIERWGRDRWT